MSKHSPGFRGWPTLSVLLPRCTCFSLIGTLYEHVLQLVSDVGSYSWRKVGQGLLEAKRCSVFLTVRARWCRRVHSDRGVGDVWDTQGLYGFRGIGFWHLWTHSLLKEKATQFKSPMSDKNRNSSWLGFGEGGWVNGPASVFHLAKYTYLICQKFYLETELIRYDFPSDAARSCH